MKNRIFIFVLLAMVLAGLLWVFSGRFRRNAQTSGIASHREQSVDPGAKVVEPEKSVSAVVLKVDETPVPPAFAPNVVSGLAPAAPHPVPVVVTAVPAPAAPVPAVTVASSLITNLTERHATARMYAAHVPLRVPEVANPDSKANKAILNTMVAKLLVHPAAPPAAVATTTTP